jgi:hypothetical protein
MVEASQMGAPAAMVLRVVEEELKALPENKQRGGRG